MKLNLPCIALLLSLFMTNAALASGDPARGKDKSTVCAACHNADGNSLVPTFPRLAGQNEDYIVHSLMAYKSGKRKNEVMKGMAAPLSRQDVEDLAAYFSSQQGLFVKK